MVATNKSWTRFVDRTDYFGKPYRLKVFDLDHSYVNTPGWSLIKPLPLTPRILTIRRWGDGRPVMTSAGGTRTKSTSTIDCFGDAGTDSDFTSLLLEAKARAAAKQTKVVGSVVVNTGQNVIEAHQIVDSILEKMARVAHARRAVKAGRYGDAVRILGVQRRSKAKEAVSARKNVAGQWLDLQYGWLPLLSDVHEGLELLVSPSGETLFRVNLYASSQKQSESSGVFNGGAQRCFRKLEKLQKVSVRYQYDLVLSDPAMRSRAQWGLTNPLLLAWELVPYSFIVDWFAPVGQYLEQFSSHDGFTFKRGVLLTKCTSTTIQTISRHPSATDAETTSGQSTAKFQQWQRSTLSSWPSPSFKGLKNPLSGMHVANAVALITNVLRKGT